MTKKQNTSDNEYEKNLKEQFKSTYEDCYGTIEKSCQYLSYGILISLFHFGQSFFIKYPIFAGIAAVSSVCTLSLFYIYSFYVFKKSQNVLEMANNVKNRIKNNVKDENEESKKINNQWLYAEYEDMRNKSNKLLSLTQVTLAISILSFLFCGYFYFYCNKQLHCSGEKSSHLSTNFCVKCPPKN